MCEDDFTFWNEQKPASYGTTLLFFKKKKETGRVEDDFTCNAVLHPDDLILFYKQNFNC